MKIVINIITWTIILLLLVLPNNENSKSNLFQQYSFSSLNKETIEKEKAYNIWKSANITLLNIQSIEGLQIRSFAINKDGRLAIAFEKSIIGIYSDSFQFQKAYKCQFQGLYGVDWNNNNLLYIGVRGDYAIEFTTDCELVDIYYFTEEDAFNEYFYNTICSDSHSIPNTTYIIKYTENNVEQQLVKCDNYDSHQEILYQYKFDSLEKTINDNIIGVTVFILLVVNIIVYIIIKIIKCLSIKNNANNIVTPQYTYNKKHKI